MSSLQMLTRSNLLPFLISPFLSLNCLPFVSDVSFVLNSSLFSLPLLAHTEHWTFSSENFHNCALYSNLLQWKVNPVESFCQPFPLTVAIDDWKAKPPLLCGQCRLSPAVLPRDLLLSTIGDRRVYTRKLRPMLSCTAKLLASYTLASCSI